MHSPATLLPLLGSRDPTRRFIADLHGVSRGNLRALWLPYDTDTTTNTSPTDGRAWTYDATIAARITPQGSGVLVSFNGIDQYATTPDTADVSFGNGLVDSPFSVVALANVTNTAAARTLVSKRGAAVDEYACRIDTTDTLRMALIDASVGVVAQRSSDAVITQGAMHLFGCSYDGGGGATAANGITLYQDGSSIVSTASNSASYVAMENLSGLPRIGDDTTLVSEFAGSMGFVALYAANLSTAQHRAITEAANRYYELAIGA